MDGLGRECHVREQTYVQVVSRAGRQRNDLRYGHHSAVVSAADDRQLDLGLRQAWVGGIGRRHRRALGGRYGGRESDGEGALQHGRRHGAGAADSTGVTRMQQRAWRGRARKSESESRGEGNSARGTDRDGRAQRLRACGGGAQAQYQARRRAMTKSVSSRGRRMERQRQWERDRRGAWR